MNLFKQPVVLSLISMKMRAASLGLKFALTLFIAKFLGLEDLGLFGLISGFTNFSPSLLGFCIMHSISRHAVTQTLEEITLTLRHYMILLLGIYIVVTIVAIGTGFAIDRMELCLIAAGLFFLVHFNLDSYTLLLNLSQPIFANFLFFLRGGLWILIYMPLAFFDESFRTLEAVLGGWAIGELVAAILFVFHVRAWPWINEHAWEPMMPWLKGEIKGAFMLYCNSLATTCKDYLDRYLISILLGLELTGVYILFWTVCSALSNLLRTGVLQFSRPRLIYAFKEKTGDYEMIFYQCLKQTLLVSVLGAAATALMMYIVVPYLNKPLVEQWMPILWFSLAAFILGMVKEVYGLVFYSQHEDKLSFKFSLYTLVVAVICNMALIPFFGLWGAGISLVVVGVAAIAIQYPAAKRLIA